MNHQTEKAHAVDGISVQMAKEQFSGLGEREAGLVPIDPVD